MSVILLPLNGNPLRDGNTSRGFAAALRKLGWLVQSFVILLFSVALFSFLFSLFRYFHSVSILLLLLWVGSICILIERVTAFKTARSQSRMFARLVSDALHNDNFDRAISMGPIFEKSPLATVVVSGLTTFKEAVHFLYDADIIKAIERGTKRSARAVHTRMNRGLSSLATIATTAPLIGGFGTVWGIIDSCARGWVGERSAWIAYTFRNLTGALLPVALGVVVAVSALWCYRYLRSEVESFDLEMRTASAELENYLLRFTYYSDT